MLLTEGVVSVDFNETLKNPHIFEKGIKSKVHLITGKLSVEEFLIYQNNIIHKNNRDALIIAT